MTERRRAYLERYRALPPCYILRRSRAKRKPKRRLFGWFVTHEGFTR